MGKWNNLDSSPDQPNEVEGHTVLCRGPIWSLGWMIWFSLLIWVAISVVPWLLGTYLRLRGF